MTKPFVTTANVSKPGPLGRIDSRDLFGSTRRIAIAHGDQTYRLQITRLGKLILTK